ncbi:MAG: ribbon-helix-helix protein, CopG family [Alphaproteobacteria bacterium]|nr:MAG: ribbon-helix-helix protein, CopG family [Alphaproteobacteria bacterium]
MRTTLTIDDDVAAELERLRRARDASLKGLVNDALRLGLRELAGRPKRKKPFRTRTFHTGGVLVKSIDNIAELLAEIEGETFR